MLVGVLSCIFVLTAFVILCCDRVTHCFHAWLAYVRTGPPVSLVVPSRASQRFVFLAQMDIAISQLGWRLGVIIRLPYVPYVQMNYLFAVTRISARDFFVSTAVGCIPGVVLYAYVGTSIKNLSAYMKGHESVGPVPEILTIGGVVVAIAAFVGLAFYARRVVRRTIGTFQAEQEPLLLSDGVEELQVRGDDDGDVGLTKCDGGAVDPSVLTSQHTGNPKDDTVLTINSG